MNSCFIRNNITSSTSARAEQQEQGEPARSELGVRVDGVRDGIGQVVHVVLRHAAHVDAAIGQQVDVVLVRQQLHLVRYQKGRKGR